MRARNGARARPFGARLRRGLAVGLRFGAAGGVIFALLSGDGAKRRIKAGERVREANHQRRYVVLDVGGMSCGGCAASVKRMIESFEEVEFANVNLSTETALVELQLRDNEAEGGGDEALRSFERTLEEKLTKSGFESKVREKGENMITSVEKTKEKRNARMRKLRESTRKVAVAWGLALVCIAGHAARAAMAHPPALMRSLTSGPITGCLAVASILGPGRQTILDGIKSLWNRSPNMNSLVTLGTFASFGMSVAALMMPGLGWPTFFEEPVMLLAIVLTGRGVEEHAKLRSSSDMADLLGLLPPNARILVGNPSSVESIQEDSWRDVPVSTIVPGDRVVVLPGDKIPVDGKVVSGKSTVNESSLTGESMPVIKEVGSTTSAGTINCDGAIVVEAERGGGDAAVADIIKAVEIAQTRAPPAQKLADLVAGKFCYGVMAASVATFAFWKFIGSKVFAEALLSAAGNIPICCIPSAAATIAKGTAVPSIASTPLLLSLQMAANVLVVACPCALGLATPVVVLVGTAMAARQGILVRGGDVLEKMTQVNTVVLDKTGTLTMGKPTIGEIVVAKDSPVKSKEGLLSMVSALEHSSRHPVAQAIVEAAQALPKKLMYTLDVKTFKQEPGLGVEGVVGGRHLIVGSVDWLHSRGINCDAGMLAASVSGVYIGINGKLAGAIAIADQIRPEAASVVATLHDKGMNVIMLSGDSENAANYVAEQIGLSKDMVYPRILPGGKSALVKQLKEAGFSVGMVGDGVNDAAALAEADVGIAMGGGVGAASDASSVVLMRDNLLQILDLFDVSKSTMNKIRQNLVWALGYNLVAIPLAAGVGLPFQGVALTPSMSGFMMGLSSLGVMANSLLLQRDLSTRPWSSKTNVHQ